LLVFANKTDVNGCMDKAEIQDVWFYRCCPAAGLTECRGSSCMPSRRTSGTSFDVVRLQVRILKKALNGLCKTPRLDCFYTRMLLLVVVFCFGLWLAAGGVAGKRVLRKVSRCIHIESFKKSQRKRKKVLVLS